MPVATEATAGAMKICDAVAAVLSQAPSSKLSDIAPRISGRPIENSRVSKLARNAPSKTAPTAKIGRCEIPPVETGPLSMTLFSAIAAGRRLVGIDACGHRHARQQALEQWLALVEYDPHWHALHHLGEIAGGVVRRQQRELRSAGRRDALDTAPQRLVGKRIDDDL